MRISVCGRLLSLVAAAGIALSVGTVSGIILATAVLTAVTTSLQFWQLRRLLGSMPFCVRASTGELRLLLSTGVFTWIQAASGVVFGQVDRVYLGTTLGAVTVASYALCIQVAQPIAGLAQSGLHFLFPYLASRNETHTQEQLRRVVYIALAVNIDFVGVGATAVIMTAHRLMTVWVGPAVAARAAGLVPAIACGSALLGANVTATYALFALRRPQVVAGVNLVAGALMVVLLATLLPRYGAYGVALARCGYGGVTLLLYVTLAKELSRSRHAAAPFPQPLLEGRL